MIKDDYTVPMVRVDLVILLLWHIILVGLLFLAEFYRIVGFAACRSASKDIQPNSDHRLSSTRITSQMSDDPSVIAQCQGPSDLSPEECSQQAVVAVRLVTQHRKVQVLKNLNFTLDKGECMNIAGLNNSGKSDLLKLIVYETKLKSGQIWIHGYPVHRHRMRCYRMVGYCPQYDNLPAEFTPRQLLYIQALFQGHRKRDARIVTEALIRMLGLYQCCDRSVHVCTSGEERRMFYAFAVLSSPRLVCVDGVPAGLDPIAKRIILSVTTIMQSMGTSFLYTSLNGLDSERLCVRTPVLFEGELWMIRSMGKENVNYKNGYQLEVRFKRKVNPNVSMSRATWNRINHFPLSPHKKFTAFMEIKFPNAVLRREDEVSMVFHIDLESTTFSTIFLVLRKDAFEMNIEDFFVTRNMRNSHFAER